MSVGISLGACVLLGTATSTVEGIMNAKNDTSVGATISRVTAGATHTPSIVQRLLRRQSMGMVVILFLLLAIFSILRPNTFLGAYNFRNIALSAAVIGVMAIGQTFVLATGGIDLSLGSVLVFGTVISAKTMSAMGGPTAGWDAVLVGTVVCILATAFWGLINGLLVAVLRIPPLIATLGTLGMALGSNPEGAVRAGLAVRRHLVIIYTISGALAGVAGIMSLAEFSTTTIGGHTSDNLASIAGAVLGGTSLFGGVATMFGTVIGILVPVTLSSGFVILGVQPFWQTFAIGAVLVIAVYVDQLSRRARNR